MLLLRHFLVLLLLLFLPAITSCSSQCFPSDLQALRSFATSFSNATIEGADHEEILIVVLGESWRGQDCCSWAGVTCTNITTTAHNLTNNSVQALRVSSLSLRYLHVDSKMSSGQLHDVLRPLCNLSFLSDLSLIVFLSPPHHYMSGFVPLPECLGDLFFLRSLYLRDCSLKGTIPSSFSRLLHLQSLDLSYNGDLSGSLLPLSTLPNLTTLELSSCSFSGALPPFHSPLLKFLSLHGNFINSTLHNFTSISNEMPSLTDLDLSSNFISGSLPSSINRLSGLIYLDLSSNILSGPLPNSLCNLTALSSLDLSNNAQLVWISDRVFTPECSASLMNLTYLDLSNNQFTGPFPSGIGSLPSLEILSLLGNRFTGPLPEEWPNLQNLQDLYLSGTSLLQNATAGGLPEWIFRAPSIRTLALESMNLQSQDFLCSTKLSMLNQTLVNLILSHNLLRGHDLLSCLALHNFTQLSILDLANNPLSVFATDIQLNPAITALDLSSCELEGDINSAFLEPLNPSKVYYLQLGDNHLSGKVPTSILGNYSNLQILNLAQNDFNGFDDESLQSNRSSFPGPTDINISNNSLATNLSCLLQSLGLLNCHSDDPMNRKYQGIDLSHNQLVGEIPASLMQCGLGLSRIKLNNNNLVGHIPHELGNLPYLETLTLNNNQLQGTIPSSIFTAAGKSSSLRLLDFSHNKLEGNLHSLFPNFSNLPTLRVLLLAHNNLTGSIPSSFGSLSSALQVIDLSHNSLTGTIPQDLQLPSFLVMTEDITATPDTLYEEVLLAIKGYESNYVYVLKVLTSLDLSSNHLTGPIPPQFGNLYGLRYLNLAHNNLNGRIPASLGKLSVLESLDLSFNELEGSIPPELSSLNTLAVFNVSYNQALTGHIPIGAQLEDDRSYIGDELLCGYPTLQACKGEIIEIENAPVVLVVKEKPTRFGVAQWMDEWISFAGLSLGTLVGFVVTLLLLHGPPPLRHICCAR